MAEVLLPAYDNGLPLVFDDAFTQSDPERLRGLKRMLRRGMGQGIQLVLLSCQPEALQTEWLDSASTNGHGDRSKQNPPTKGGGKGAASSDHAPDVISIQLR